jgi:hypothetical protein
VSPMSPLPKSVCCLDLCLYPLDLCKSCLYPSLSADAEAQTTRYKSSARRRHFPRHFPQHHDLRPSFSCPMPCALCAMGMAHVHVIQSALHLCRQPAAQERASWPALAPCHMQRAHSRCVRHKKPHTTLHPAPPPCCHPCPPCAPGCAAPCHPPLTRSQATERLRVL